MSFSFVGTVPVSKSMLNRAMIIQSFDPQLEIQLPNGKTWTGPQTTGVPAADDIQLMHNGLKSMFAGEPIQCGLAGTVLRFLALRAARIPGVHELRGEERLFARPQDDLYKLLGQLGSELKISKNSLRIETIGWKIRGDGIWVNSEKSSQFASAVLLNCWNLDSDLHLVVNESRASQGYFAMTLSMMSELGFKFNRMDNEIFVKSKQLPSKKVIPVEIDLSSAFAVAAMAATSGSAYIKDFPINSLQPDRRFVDLLKEMNVPIEQHQETLSIKICERLSPIQANIEGSPDLFPILCVLAAFADGSSAFSGCRNLRYKESDRIEKSVELVRAMGVKVGVDENIVRIFGPVNPISVDVSSIDFDTANDHRMVMAAAIANSRWISELGKRPIFRVKNVSCVHKSFPEFVKMAGEYL